MKIQSITTMALLALFIVPIAGAGEIKLNHTLPPVTVEDKGLLVSEYEIIKQKMVFKEGTEIKYRKWKSRELTGRVNTIYHLAAWSGIDQINKPYIDALIAAELPEKMPDSPYKTTTILNTNDSFWGTAGIASMRFKNSQKEFPYACYVNDEQGHVQKTWGLKTGGSAVIVVNAEGRVIYFKEGKMTEPEIRNVVSMIKKELGI
jgi:YtfJ family uncharacterized protein